MAAVDPLAPQNDIQAQLRRRLTTQAIAPSPSGPAPTPAMPPPPGAPPAPPKMTTQSTDPFQPGADRPPDTTTPPIVTPPPAPPVGPATPPPTVPPLTTPSEDPFLPGAGKQPGTGTPPPTPAPPAGPGPDAIADFLNHSGIANQGQWGGGWDQSWATGAPHALQAAIANGLSGQAAIDWVAKNYPSVAGQIAWYPDKGIYGMPGSYAAPNAAKNGQLDLIQRSGKEGADSANPGLTVPPNPWTAQIRALLMQRLGADMTPVSENDLNIAQPYAAANLAAQRSQQTERTALAERLAASGDTSGSLQQGIQQSAERNAVGLGGIKADLIQKAYASKVQDLNSAMQQALASGDQETAYAIQVQLANLQAQLAREGMGVNLAEFTANQNNKTVTTAAG